MIGRIDVRIPERFHTLRKISDRKGIDLNLIVRKTYADLHIHLSPRVRGHVFSCVRD